MSRRVRSEAYAKKGSRLTSLRMTTPVKWITRKDGRAVSQLLLKFGVFGFGLFEDGDVGVGVFPEGEEVLVGGAGFR